MATEAEAVAAIVKEGAVAAQVVKTAAGREFLLTAPNAYVRDVSEPFAVDPKKPPFIQQAVFVQTRESLVDYTNRFKGENTILLADIQTNSITALMDYHAPDGAEFVAHRAEMVLPFSEEWQTWASVDGKLMDQLEFARFIEENAVDITEPSGADLLEAVRDLQAHRKVNFTKAVRTETDNENFEFSDETEARTRGGVEVPTKFKLLLPVYFNGDSTSLTAFLRWRLNEGRLLLGVKLHRAEHVRQAVFKQVVEDVAARTERPAMFGRLNPVAAQVANTAAGRLNPYA